MPTKTHAFRILVATDGSSQARAALTTVMHFPWPADSQVRIVASRRIRAEYRRSILLSALDRNADAAAESARRTLSRRWPDVEAEVVDAAPVKGILDAASRFRADLIVVGWRGHGIMRRLLMGSVARGVVRTASSAVLVVRRAVRVQRIVLGLDGSRMAGRALDFVSTLTPPTGGLVVLVSAVENLAVPSHALVPNARALAREVKLENARRAETAMRELRQAADRLKRAGWPTRTIVTKGEPLRDLLGAVGSERAQLLVVGARGTSGVRQLLLGSVAQGALDRSPVPVVIAR
jgi:nucleotide-binding universal stress UspA family protein